MSKNRLKKTKKTEECCGNGCGAEHGGEDCACHKQEAHCPCDACDSGLTVEQLRDQEAEMIKKQGWVAHMVSCGDDQTSTGTNYHTHGFTESYGCPDILPIDPKILHGIGHSVVNFIKGNVGGPGKSTPTKPTDGMITDGIIKGYKVMFKAATECDRAVLRLILPDKHGCLTPDASEPYNKQWIGLVESN